MVRKTFFVSSRRRHTSSLCDWSSDVCSSDLAVACAAELQRGIRKRNAGAPQDQRIEFRIGVNVGDVIVQGEDIFGDGVNVAARLESIATPGGITISGPVRDHVGNRLDLAFEDMGEQTLKNIERPIRVYRVSLDGPAAQ